MPLQMVRLPIRSHLSTEVRKLLGNLANALVELKIFAFHGQNPPRVRRPREDVYVAVIPIKGSTKDLSQFDFVVNLPAKFAHSFSDCRVELDALDVVCVSNPLTHLRGTGPAMKGPHPDETNASWRVMPLAQLLAPRQRLGHLRHQSE